MALEIKGINKVLKRLTNLENIKTVDAVTEVAEEMQNRIRDRAQTFSDVGYQYISKCEPRIYAHGCFIDVGLKSDGSTWNLWKGLYFHNFGYRQFYYGHDTGKMTTCYMLWFERAVQDSTEAIIQKLKLKIKDEVRKALAA